jgi:hypothetical protein
LQSEAVADEETRAAPLRHVAVRMSRAMLAPLVESKVDKTTPVTDFILGTNVWGKARTTGQPRLEMVANPDNAEFNIVLTGTTVSRTVGRNGPAVIYTRADTNFTATKRIAFQPGLGFVAEPAKISAKTRTTNEGVGATRGGLIGRIIVRRASQQVWQSQPQVEAIARQRAETRISAAFDDYVAGRLARVNKMADTRAAIAMILWDEKAPRFTASTTPDYVQIVASAADCDPVQPPASGPCDGVQFWVHRAAMGDEVDSALELWQSQPPSPQLPAKALAVASTLVKVMGTGGESSPAVDPISYEKVGEWRVLELSRMLIGQTPPTPAEPTAIAQRERRWTSADGRFTCVASVVRLDENSVTLRRSDSGQLITVPLDRISSTDRRLLLR